MIFDKTGGLKTLNREGIRKSFNTSRVSKILGVLSNFGITKDDLNDSDQWRGNSYKGSITQATHTFAFLQAMKFIKLSSGIDYFIVVPGLSRNTHFAQLTSVLGSIQENGKLDYQKYKGEMAKIEVMDNQQFIDYSRQAIGGFEFIK